MSCDQEPFAYDNYVGLGEEFGRRPAEPNQYEQIQMASKATPTPLQENTPHPVSSITDAQPEENAQSTGSSVCHKTTCKRLIVGLCVAVFVVVIILTATFLSLNRNDGKQSDVNECESSPCSNGGNCTDDVGRYQCSCPTGYTGDNCNTDINECESNPCRNGGNCTDSVGRYQCSCALGYTGDNCHIDLFCTPKPVGTLYKCVTTISRDVEVHVLQLYYTGVHYDGHNHGVRGEIQVDLKLRPRVKPPTSVKLLLTSYYAADWAVKAAPDIRITQILVGYYHDGTNVVTLNGESTRIAEKLPDRDYYGYGRERDLYRLRRIIVTHFGYMSSYTGSYGAVNFTLEVGRP